MSSVIAYHGIGYNVHITPKRIPVQIVGKIQSNKNTGWRWIDAHVVRRVIEKLCPGVTFDVVRIVIAPTQLNVQPVLLRCRVVHYVPKPQQLIYTFTVSFTVSDKTGTDN